MSKGFDPLNLEGRGFDGWYYAVAVRDQGTVRLCDHDGPEAVWARVKEGKITGADVTFSGCRAEADGRIDGYGIYPAEDVLSIRNFGPSVVGAGSVEARIMKLEERVEEQDATLREQEGLLDAIDAALRAESDEGEEGDGEPGAAEPSDGLKAAAGAEE